MGRAIRRMMHESPMLFVGMFSVIGALFLISGIYTRVTAVKIQGIVKGYAQSNYGGYRRIIEFKYNGETIALPTANANKNQKGNVGDEITVLYRPGNKKHVNVKGDYLDLLVGTIAILLAIGVAISNV